MCDKNINEIIDLDFTSINDEFNWVNNGSNAIETSGGQLVLRPDGSTNQFSRSLGNIDPGNNRIRLRVNMDIVRPQTSTDDTICAVFGVYVGTQLLQEFTVFLDDIASGSSTEYNLERIYQFENISGVASLRVTVPEGFQNEIKLDYLKAEDFNFCDDDYRSYFIIDEFLENSKNSGSSAIQLREWKIDGVETLTSDFFADNNDPGGIPSDDWKFAKAEIDGSNRIQEDTNPNSFNPFVTEWGLVFDTVDSFHGGKPTGTTTGNDYGPGILTIGFDKPAILNAQLVRKEGAFFIDIDYTKDLRVVFDVVINDNGTDPFVRPSIYRRYYIIFDVQKCECLYYYETVFTNTRPASLIVDVKEDGFLSGITGIEEVENTIQCDESFSFTGQSGVFEFEIDFGVETGQAGINYNAFEVPDKFEIEWNGQIFSSGFVGNSSFDQQLMNAGIPTSEINTASPSSGQGQLLFNKDQASPNTAIIRVTAPLPSTGWDIAGICPEEDTTVSSMVEVGEGNCDAIPTRWDDVYVDSPTPFSANPQNGDVIYTDPALTIPYDGNDDTYRMRVVNPPFSIVSQYTFDISSQGVVSNRTECDTGGGGGGDIDETSSQNSGCFSCWSFDVNVPAGGSRHVQFIFNLQGAGNASACSGSGTAVLSNTSETISSTKSYRIGIDADATAQPGMEVTSTITVIVRATAGGAVLDQQNFSRTHGDQNC